MLSYDICVLGLYCNNMLGSFWKEQFAARNFYPIHDEPAIFITCQWQKEKTKPNLLYLMYRTIVMLTFLVTWIHTMIVQRGPGKYPIFITNWGYIACTIQALLAFIMLSTAVLGRYFKKFVNVQKATLKMYPAYWLLNTVATPSAFVITTIYWSILYEGNEQYFIMNYFVHGNNSLFMFMDLCMVSHQNRISHVVYIIAFGLTYSLFSLIYYAVGGTSYGGARYIYSILDWSKPGQTIGVCLGVIVFLIILHMLIVLISVLRRTSAEKCCGKELDISIAESRGQTLPVNEAMLNEII